MTPPTRIQQTYQTAERESLPRAVLYGHYREHCEQRGAPVWNIANFGRLLRYCFPAVRIRRLGHRHQSKYYYEGIAVRPDSELSRREDVIMTQRSGDRYAAQAQTRARARALVTTARTHRARGPWPRTRTHGDVAGLGRF